MIITGAAIYAVVKFWLPAITAVILVIKGMLAVHKFFSKMRTDVSEWAGQMLDNHMAHMQDAVERGAKAVEQMNVTMKTFAGELTQLRKDFQDHTKEDLRVQTAILTGLEVLKDR